MVLCCHSLTHSLVSLTDEGMAASLSSFVRSLSFVVRRSVVRRPSSVVVIDCSPFSVVRCSLLAGFVFAFSASLCSQCSLLGRIRCH